MKADRFVGTWRLVHLESRTADGEVSYPWGKDAAGYIIYTADGYLAVQVMGADRPLFASGDIKGGSIAEKAAAAETYISYCGRYEVLDDAVIHHIEVSLFPNWVGVVQKRFFRFEANRLVLTTPPVLIDGVERTSEIVWERVAEGPDRKRGGSPRPHSRAGADAR